MKDGWAMLNMGWESGSCGSKYMKVCCGLRGAMCLSWSDLLRLEKESTVLSAHSCNTVSRARLSGLG
jgi:hypothetical protein